MKTSEQPSVLFPLMEDLMQINTVLGNPIDVDADGLLNLFYPTQSGITELHHELDDRLRDDCHWQAYAASVNQGNGIVPVKHDVVPADFILGIVDPIDRPLAAVVGAVYRHAARFGIRHLVVPLPRYGCYNNRFEQTPVDLIEQLCFASAEFARSAHEGLVRLTLVMPTAEHLTFAQALATQQLAAA